MLAWSTPDFQDVKNPLQGEGQASELPGEGYEGNSDEEPGQLIPNQRRAVFDPQKLVADVVHADRQAREGDD